MSPVSVLRLLVLGLFLATFHVCHADPDFLHGHGDSSKCLVQQNGTTEKNVGVVVGNSTGSLLQFGLTQTYNAPEGNNITGDFVQSVQTGSYTLDAEELYSFNITSSLDQNSTIVVRWGPAIEGSDVGTFYLQNGVVSGNIDGRSFVPFSLGQGNITVTFTDGQPPPVLHPKANTTALVQVVQNQLPQAYPHCVPPPPAGGNSSVIVPRQGTPLDWTQTLAHSTDFDDAACFACQTGADAAAAAGYAGCGFICGSLFLSWECGSCISGVTDTYNNAQAACQASTNCCKNRCGGIFGGCCGATEVCFPGWFNLCCDQDTTPCGIDICCAADQTCSAGFCCPTPQVCGAGDSICCPAGQTCDTAGDSCCPDCGGPCCGSDVCLGGDACCAEADVCGDICCPSDAGLLGTGHCLAAGLCCYNDEINADGLCCSPGETNCGGQCCSGTCENDQCVQTSQGCLAEGGTGQTCSVQNPTCSGFAICENGCCIEQPK